MATNVFNCQPPADAKLLGTITGEGTYQMLTTDAMDKAFNNISDRMDAMTVEHGRKLAAYCVDVTFLLSEKKVFAVATLASIPK